ncbi:YjjG family noncanonical pyrimidine nucleotidase [Solitalea lacus]|uniref:YjjG family noncanonical pyrimidine nucleotidase n=1 Tax=Solitalea lacus TaxID=2911172 RepID=UPI001EDA6B70|nr:YjjG family noncanonical pyrimidine nucleotidase [Solitalea lacus]UKJ08207.1 YjjG family noncanonical pyrimidine nucleotidase [Solitalea lacus]
MKTYRHLFFDLDHTIWDFDKNAEETLRDLFVSYNLVSLGINSVDLFIETYTENNHQLWAQYHKGLISKEHLRHERFNKTFREFGIDKELIPTSFETDYVRICPTKTNLFPKAHDTLSYLQSKYKLHLISNGFYESTLIKVETTGIGKYFDNINISEKIGVNKPDPAIFHYAMQLAGTNAAESMMIGDSIEADIMGAINVGMDCVFFNPREEKHNVKINHEIKSLDELLQIL